MPRGHPQPEHHPLLFKVAVALLPVVPKDGLPIALGVKPEIVHPNPLVANVPGGFDHLEHPVVQGGSLPDAQVGAVKVFIPGVVPLVGVDIFPDSVAQVIQVAFVEARGHGGNFHGFPRGHRVVQQLAPPHQGGIPVPVGHAGFPPPLVVEGDVKTLFGRFVGKDEKLVPHAATIEPGMPSVAAVAVHFDHFRVSLGVEILGKAFGQRDRF